MTEAAAAAVRHPRLDRSGTSSGRERDLAVAGTVLVLLVAYVPGLDNGPVSIRLLFALPLGLVGTVALVRLAAAGDLAARCAVAFVAWSAVATLWSIDVGRSFAPRLGVDRGWLVLAAFAGCYAIGRRLSIGGVRMLEGAVLIGLSTNAVFAVAQVIVDGGGLLSLSDGRAIGLVPSPVYLGGLLAGGLPLAASRVVRADGRWWPWLPLVALFAMAVDASGSRVGMAAGLAVTVWAVRRAPLPRASAVLVAVAIGLGVLHLAAAGGSSSSTGRLNTQATSGVDTRIEMWGVALDHVGERPIVGWGPNSFAAVVTPHVSESFARAEGPDKVFFDAHNIVVEHLLSSGVVGALFLLAFAAVAARRSAGPLAYVAAGIAISWLLEPASISTAPLALVALGAAAPRELVAPPGSRSALWAGVAVVLGVVALVVAGRLLRADQLVHRGITTASVQDLAAAEAVGGPDPVVLDAQAQLFLALARASGVREPGEDALAIARRNLRVEPDRGTWWYRAAVIEFSFGSGVPRDRATEARRLLLRANELHPWSASTLGALVNVETALERPAEARRWEERRCRIVECDGQVGATG